ncbi:sensor histidine kinase [Chryseolinea lacunae]|uniref:histidine kinase n=1 Tax=Chryseolinea lacunae TaxID=2801331 RepID=A0ABS1KJV7_9BACT|nr:HAMP domain-containing sensor histidine kinase [Chryseolinea lacunae]MBL0739741.1 HAMP domain-containing histidine kinase [Chryseolinea lacunae]
MKSKYLILSAGSLLLFIAGLMTAYFSDQPVSPEAVAEPIAHRLQNELQAMDVEAAALLDALAQQEPHDVPSRRRFAFFVYDTQQLLSWTDNSFVPSQASVADAFTLRLLKGGNGDYLARKWKVNDALFLVGVIPLSRKFSITNNYLEPWWNRRVFPSGDISVYESGSGMGAPVCVEGQCPFKIGFDSLEPFRNPPKVVAIVLIAAAILLLVTLVYSLLDLLPYPEGAFLFLYGFLIGLRFLMIRFNFPNGLYATDLFNPKVFASSTLNASLGDLLLNELALLLLCFYAFRNYQRFKSYPFMYQRKVLAWLLSVVAGVCVLFAALFPFVVIQTINNNSSIVIDISQSLQFDKLRVMATLAVLLAGTCSFFFGHAFMRLLIADGNTLRVLGSFFVAGIIFAGINALSGQSYMSSLILGTAYFLVVYFMKLYASLRRLSFATFAYLFISIFFLSANGAYGIHYFTRQEKISSQFKFAENFLVDRDYFGEYLLRETSLKIEDDAFIQSRINVPFLSRDVIRQKIRQVFLPSYFNKYDVEIFLFNSRGEPLDNRSSSSLSQVIGIYDQDAFRTDYERVYFVTSPAKDVTQKYLVLTPIKRGNSLLGHVMLDLSLKKLIPDNVYPELLVDNRTQQFYHTQDISYAVFSEDAILFSSGKFNYAQAFPRDWLGEPDLYRKGISSDGFTHAAQEYQNNRVAVVSSQQPPVMLALSNFSFLLVLGLIIILMLLMAQGIANYIQGEKIYFSARIQVLLNLSFFLPLILVSATTLNLTNRSTQNQLVEEYLSRAETVSTQLSVQLDRYVNGGNESATTFEHQLGELAGLTNLDANVFSAKGELLASSQPLIFENNLMSRYINASALQKINKGDRVVIESERVGKLEYFVSYAPLNAPLTGKLVGILGIPFFQSASSLERVQINLVSNILNIFALIFIALVIVSYFVSRWLTFPLKFITQSLQRTSLTKMNQPLTWKADDEIGLMVKEYNQMLFKLSESKAELEQTQRETAWREIAQQVAHEIKNPLTPMKLTLQQLERSVGAGTNTPEKTEKAVSSLLTQVDTLNDIASSFSTFAKMPEPVIQRLELVALVKRTVVLHASSGDIHFDSVVREAFVQGDEQLLGRTFSNLILNAFQAARPGHALRVTIQLTQHENTYRLAFRDNGRGIAPQVAERIFLSHFTTKKSGSGLGLAIAKQAIEQMQGRIWFETAVGKGTVFYVELPVSVGV